MFETPVEGQSIMNPAATEKSWKISALVARWGLLVLVGCICVASGQIQRRGKVIKLLRLTSITVSLSIGSLLLLELLLSAALPFEGLRFSLSYLRLSLLPPLHFTHN